MEINKFTLDAYANACVCVCVCVHVSLDIYIKYIPRLDCQYIIDGGDQYDLVQHYCPYAYSYHLYHRYHVDQSVDQNRFHYRCAHVALMMAQRQHRHINHHHLHNRPKYGKNRETKLTKTGTAEKV